MKDEMKRERKPEERRRFLGLLGGLGAVGFALPFLPVGEKPKELELKEADFYRPHDLAG
jgi:hypothetical protein